MKMILKEQKQEKQEEKQEKKEKQKKKQKSESVKITKFMIRQRLLMHFQNHISEEEKTSQEEIFQAVTGVNTLAVNSFARFYFWKSIEEVIRKLRKSECFIIKKRGYYFVLKHQEEADYFRKICDRAIEGMNKAETRADEWVDGEKWKDFEKKDYTDEDEEELKPKPEEIIQSKINKAKTKVVKLWKGENEDIS